LNLDGFKLLATQALTDGKGFQVPLGKRNLLTKKRIAGCTGEPVAARYHHRAGHRVVEHFAHQQDAEINRVSSFPGLALTLAIISVSCS